MVFCAVFPPVGNDGEMLQDAGVDAVFGMLWMLHPELIPEVYQKVHTIVIVVDLKIRCVYPVSSPCKSATLSSKRES